MGYKSFISAINTQVGGLLSKFLSTATQSQSFSSVAGSSHPDPGDMSRRKTEPMLYNNKSRRSQPEITPLTTTSMNSSKSTTFVSGSGPNKQYYGPSPRRSSSSNLNSPTRRESDVSLVPDVSAGSPDPKNNRVLNEAGTAQRNPVTEVDDSSSRYSSAEDEVEVETESSCSIV